MGITYLDFVFLANSTCISSSCGIFIFMSRSSLIGTPCRNNNATWYATCLRFGYVLSTATVLILIYLIWSWMLAFASTGKLTCVQPRKALAYTIGVSSLTVWFTTAVTATTTAVVTGTPPAQGITLKSFQQIHFATSAHAPVSSVIRLPRMTSLRNHTEVCTLRATMHGSSVSGEHPVQARFCAKSNMYVFVAYDDIHYKMTAVSLEQAKASSTPSSADKFITAPNGSINIDAVGTLCNMWEGYGYATQAGGGYDVKNVQVTACGQCIMLYVWPRSHAHSLAECVHHLLGNLLADRHKATSSI